MKNRKGAADARKRWKRAAFERDPHCHYCRRPLILKQPPDTRHHPFNLATVDHMHPLTHDGRDEPSNYALSCWKCNHDKDDMTYETFLLIVANRKRLDEARKPKYEQPSAERRPWMQGSY